MISTRMRVGETVGETVDKTVGETVVETFAGFLQRKFIGFAWMVGGGGGIIVSEVRRMATPTVERDPIRGNLIVSGIVNGHLLARRYYGYTREEAVSMWQADAAGSN